MTNEFHWNWLKKTFEKDMQVLLEKHELPVAYSGAIAATPLGRRRLLIIGPRWGTDDFTVGQQYGFYVDQFGESCLLADRGGLFGKNVTTLFASAMGVNLKKAKQFIRAYGFWTNRIFATVPIRNQAIEEEVAASSARALTKILRVVDPYTVICFEHTDDICSPKRFLLGNLAKISEPWTMEHVGDVEYCLGETSAYLYKNLALKACGTLVRELWVLPHPLHYKIKRSINSALLIELGNSLKCLTLPLKRYERPSLP